MTRPDTRPTSRESLLRCAGPAAGILLAAVGIVWFLALLCSGV